MVIDSKQLKKIINPNIGVEALRHIPSRIQLAVYETEPNKAFVQELDGMGNIKKQKVFEGYLGFWKATAEFENRIKDLLGLQEVYGFEVGMIIQMNQDTKKYKKGDFVAVLEVDANGAAIRTQKLNTTQLNRVKSSPQVIPLRKIDGVDFLELNGKKSFDDFKINELYNLKGDVDSVRFSKYKNLQANNSYPLVNDELGGSATIQFFGFETDINGESRLAAEVIFEDGSKGKLPLNAFAKSKKTQAMPTSTSKQALPKDKVNERRNKKQLLRELEKRSFYILQSLDGGWAKAGEDVFIGASVKAVEIPNDKLPIKDFFVVSTKGANSSRYLYSSVYGWYILGFRKKGSLDNFLSEINGFEILASSEIEKIKARLETWKADGLISPRYKNLEDLIE